MDTRELGEIDNRKGGVPVVVQRLRAWALAVNETGATFGLAKEELDLKAGAVQAHHLPALSLRSARKSNTRRSFPWSVVLSHKATRMVLLSDLWLRVALYK